jgi:hypothetical protein
MPKTWRDRMRPIIAQVLRETNGVEKAARKKLRTVRPFKLRRGWAYKVWLNEIRLQLAAYPSSNLDRPTRRFNPDKRQLMMKLPSRSVDHGTTDLRSLGVKPIEDDRLAAQDLVQQGAVNAISWLLGHGCTESNARAMLASLRKSARLLRRETTRRGLPQLFARDQTG